MSATVTKATRRDLRRAVGEDALKMVEDHEQGLLGHAMALKRHERLLQLAHEYIVRLQTDIEQMRADIASMKGQ